MIFHLALQRVGNELTPSSNNRIAILPRLGRHFNISFDIFLASSHSSRYYSGVIRLTTKPQSENGEGTRIAFCLLSSYFRFSNEVNSRRSLIGMAVSRWYKIEALQYPKHLGSFEVDTQISRAEKWFTLIKVDGKEVYNHPATYILGNYENVELYIGGDKRYSTFSGKIKDLKIFNLMETNETTIEKTAENTAETVDNSTEAAKLEVWKVAVICVVLVSICIVVFLACLYCKPRFDLFHIFSGRNSN